MDGKMNFDKFDGKNFKQWKFQIKCALRAKGLDITRKRPESNPEQWDKDDGMAMYIITSAMDLHQVAMVENCETASEVMMKLESIFEQKSELNKMIIHERFYQYKMATSDTIAQHIAKIESLAKDLKESGEKISDTAVITKILSTLPPKYRALRQAWLSLDPKQQTIVNLTARLLDEETSLSVENEDEMALLVAKQRKFNNYPRPSTSYDEGERHENESRQQQKHRFPCYNCGKRGHFAKECRLRKNTYQENRNISSLNIVSGDSETEKWILDSGASAHMTYKIENFQELNAYSGPQLKLGNEDVLEVHGIGNILINKFTLGQWKKMTLKDVLYVPKLKRNLISEGKVVRRGCEIVKKNGDAMIYKDDELILCGYLQSNNLYELKMEVIKEKERKVEVCNIVQNVDLKTWNEHLGNINIKEISRNEIFDEQKTPTAGRNWWNILLEEEEKSPDVTTFVNERRIEEINNAIEQDDDSRVVDNICIENEDNSNELPQEVVERGHGMTHRPHVGIYGRGAANIIEFNSPATYEEASSSKEFEEWTKAINEELNSHDSNNTYSSNINEMIKRYKARMCEYVCTWLYTNRRS